MFRFSTRELMVAMFAVAMLFAWVTEHCRMEAAMEAVKESREKANIAGNETRKWQQVHRRLTGERSQIENVLADHRIELHWSPSRNAWLATRNNNGDLASFHIVSEHDSP